MKRYSGMIILLVLFVVLFVPRSVFAKKLVVLYGGDYPEICSEKKGSCNYVPVLSEIKETVLESKLGFASRARASRQGALYDEVQLIDMTQYTEDAGIQKFQEEVVNANDVVFYGHGSGNGEMYVYPPNGDSFSISPNHWPKGNTVDHFLHMGCSSGQDYLTWLGNETTSNIQLLGNSENIHIFQLHGNDIGLDSLVHDVRDDYPGLNILEIGDTLVKGFTLGFISIYDLMSSEEKQALRSAIPAETIIDKEWENIQKSWFPRLFNESIKAEIEMALNDLIDCMQWIFEDTTAFENGDYEIDYKALLERLLRSVPNRITELKSLMDKLDKLEELCAKYYPDGIKFIQEKKKLCEKYLKDLEVRIAEFSKRSPKLGGGASIILYNGDDNDYKSANELSDMLDAARITINNEQLSKEQIDILSKFDNVVIVGGERAMPPEITADLEEAGLNVRRFGGETWEDTRDLIKAEVDKMRNQAINMLFPPDTEKAKAPLQEENVTAAVVGGSGASSGSTETSGGLPVEDPNTEGGSGQIITVPAELFAPSSGANEF